MGLRHAPARYPADHRGARRLVAALLVAACVLLTAGSLALPDAVRQAWASRIYPSLQPSLTAVSSVVPVALLDVVVVAAGGGAIGLVVWGRRRRRTAVAAAALLLGVGGAWFTFQALWGWHYQKPTLEARLIGTAEPSALSEAAPRVARHAVHRLNVLAPAAHASPWPADDDLVTQLRAPMQQALHDVAVAWAPRLPRPKHTLFDGYFRRTGIDGLTNPFGLEIVLHGRLLPVERPAVLAHEWAHLAGFADESDASFVAWMTGLRAGGRFEYAAWLAVLPHLVSALPADERRTLVATLGELPRADLREMARRSAERWPALQLVAWRIYDRFLRVNRVEEGIARYDAVTRLLLLAADPLTGRVEGRRTKGQQDEVRGRTLKP